MITMKNKINYKVINSNTYTLLTYQFALVIAMKCAELTDNLTAFVEVRSSMAEWVLLFKIKFGMIPDLKAELYFNCTTKSVCN